MSGRGRRATVVAAGALVLALTACLPSPPDPVRTSVATASAAPTTTGPTDAPSPVATPTAAASPSAAPTAPASAAPTAPADSHAGWQQIATPNGTATFMIPPGWTVEIDGDRLEYDGQVRWQNIIRVRDEFWGVQLNYADGPFDDFARGGPFTVVTGERVETLDREERAAAASNVSDPASLDHAAAAWWFPGFDQDTMAVVSLETAEALDGTRRPSSVVQDGQRAISFRRERSVRSEREAAEWLAGEEAAVLLEIIGTLDLNAAPASALP